MDIIFIREYKLDTLIGIYEWERVVPQTIQLDLEIAIPRNDAGRSDQISDTLDYSAIVSGISEALAQQHFSLLERLAEFIAQLVMEKFHVPWVKVSVAKLGTIRGIKQLGVCIERGKRTA